MSPHDSQAKPFTLRTHLTSPVYYSLHLQLLPRWKAHPFHLSLQIATPATVWARFSIWRNSPRRPGAEETAPVSAGWRVPGLMLCASCSALLSRDCCSWLSSSLGPQDPAQFLAHREFPKCLLSGFRKGNKEMCGDGGQNHCPLHVLTSVWDNL